MSVKYQNDMTPFDMSEKPSKQYFFLMPLLWLAAYIDTRNFCLKIRKEGMKGLKPPYLVIATHQGPADYSATPLALFPHRAMYVSDMEGFENYGKWLYRGLGCIGKRRFVSDISVVKNIRYALDIGQPVVLYPESRHSNAGTTAYISKNLGKLCKFLDVPVVLFTLYGSYLANPFWDEFNTRKVPLEGTLKLLFTRERVRELPEYEIQNAIEEGLKYNEYEYQTTRKILIREPKRAEGIHKPLYTCRKCGTNYKMSSHDAYLKCNECGAEFFLREDGYLECTDDKEIFNIPEWYEWERDNETLYVNEALDTDSFKRSFNISVEALPNEKGFVKLGAGVLTLDKDEYILKFGNETLRFPHRSRESIQTEYDYKGQGEAVVLSTRDCCYYLYCKDPDFSPTELQFISEYLYQRANGLLNTD